MKRKLVLLLSFLIVFGGGIGLGYYIRSQTLNPRATLPGFLDRISSFFIKEGQKGDDDLLYHDTDLPSFILNGSTKTKVAVTGIVDKVTHEPDGDYHVIVRSQYVPAGLYLVTEFIPEIKLPLPNVGDNIKIWGIVRFDELHNWWELHPIAGWEKVK